MQTSIVIVSKDRKSELDKTLSILEKLIDFSKNEILVFLDGCKDDSYLLKEKYKNSNWYFSEKCIGASAARKELYTYAKGEILIGFDDDSHPLNSNFIELTRAIFTQNPNIAIIAFEEIRGDYQSDEEAMMNSKNENRNYLIGEFVGCGFAIKKDKYNETQGFPTWVDIYGEEACVSIQILDLGYDILYTNSIVVHHRINWTDRIEQGRNYFRFGKQLKNETFFYLVYYPNPIRNIVRLYWHNLKKYALKDWKYFQIYISTIFSVILQASKILKFRDVVSAVTINKWEKLH